MSGLRAFSRKRITLQARTLSFLAEAARDEELRVFYQATGRSIRDALERAFRALEAQGSGRGIDPVQAARVCYGLYEGCLAQKALDPELDVEPTSTRCSP